MPYGVAIAAGALVVYPADQLAGAARYLATGSQRARPSLNLRRRLTLR